MRVVGGGGNANEIEDRGGREGRVIKIRIACTLEGER